MKRYLSILLCLLCCCLLLWVPVSASEAECRLSDDLQTLYYNGHTYTRVNTLAFDYTNAYLDVELVLSAAQAERFCSGSAYTNDDTSIVELHMLTPDGTQVITGYLLDSLVPEYHQALADRDTPRLLGYFWDDLTASPEDLKGTPVTLDAHTAYWSEAYPVLIPLEGSELFLVRGTLLADGHDYYYVDHDENNIVNRTDYAKEMPSKEIPAYQITDPDLCNAISKARISENTLGLNDGSTLVTGILMGLIFGLTPCCILVVALIFSFRSRKRFYRNAWRITAAITGTELIIFVTVLIILLRA